MRTLLLILTLSLAAFTLPAHAQSGAVAATTCISGQLLCNKACGKGPAANSCINLCGMKAQSCINNNGRWPGASTADEDDSPAKRTSRRQRAADPEDEEERPRSSSSSSSSRKSRKDGCNTDAEFVHSWPVDKANDEFKFKFRVSSEDCRESSCSGYIHYRIHYNWRSGGNSGKSTLVSYRIPGGQRSIEVTDKVFPGPVGIPLDVRDVEIGEVSCRQ